MQSNLLLTMVLALVTGGTMQASGGEKGASRLDVVFVQPEKYTDLKDEYSDTGRARDSLLAEFQGELEKLAPRYVADGQHLEVKFLDIDLAGDFEPWHGGRFDDVRILREIYPPRMEIEFRLTGRDGQVISEGKRQLRSLGYLMSAGSPTSDPLRYDKEMLRDWMRREFKRTS